VTPLVTHFGTRSTLWNGPEIRIQGETIGLFVDNEAAPSLLRGVLFYRHRFYLPFAHSSKFAVSDFSIRCSQENGLFQCSLTYFIEDCEIWPVHRGVEVLLRSAKQCRSYRPTLQAFRVDTRILPLALDLGFVNTEFYFGADNLKTN
jgi:hypothetical protein